MLEIGDYSERDIAASRMDIKDRKMPFEPSCLADFKRLPNRVSAEGNDVSGNLSCERGDCYIPNIAIPNVIFVPVDGEDEASFRVADEILKEDARWELRFDCIDWISDPVNQNQEIPDEKLPATLRRNYF